MLPSIIAYRYTSGNCKVSNYNKISISNIFNRAVRHMGISHSCDKDVESVRESAISDQLLLCNYSTKFNRFFFSYPLKKKIRLGSS